MVNPKKKKIQQIYSFPCFQTFCTLRVFIVLLQIKPAASIKPIRVLHMKIYRAYYLKM